MRKKKILKRLLSFTLIFALLLSTIAYADNSMRVAVLKNIEGNVKIRRAGGEKLFPAIEKAGLVQGDSVITGKGAGAILIIDSDKEVKIGENTQLVMSELMKSIKTMGDKTTLSLLSGKVLITINKKLVKDAKFEIKTPTAVMGVRGTTLETIVIGNRTFVTVFEGSVNARNTTTDKETNVGAFQLAELNNTSDPNKPIEIKTVDIKTLDLFELEGLKDNSKLPPEIQDQIKQQYEIKKMEEANKPPAPSPTEAPPPSIIFDQPTGTPPVNGGNPTPGPTNQPPAPTGTTPPPTGGGGGTGRDNGGTPTPPPTNTPTPPPIVHVSNIQVKSPLDDEYIGVGNHLQMTADVMPENASNKIVIWTVSSTGGSATIDTNGILTASQAGEVEVKATSLDGEVEGTKSIMIGYDIGTVGIPFYNLGNTVEVEACNSEMNTDSNTIQHYTVHVKSTWDPTGIDIDLVESSKNSAKFTSSVVLFSGDTSSSGHISTKNDDEVEFRIVNCDFYPGNTVYTLVRAVADINVGQFKYATSVAKIKTLLDGYAALLPGSNPMGLTVTNYNSLSSTEEKNEAAAAMYAECSSYVDVAAVQARLNTAVSEAHDRMTLVASYKNAISETEILALLNANNGLQGWKLDFGANYSDYPLAYRGNIAKRIHDAQGRLHYSTDLQSALTAYINLAGYEMETWDPDRKTYAEDAVAAVEDVELRSTMEGRINAIATAVTAMGNSNQCNQFNFSVLGNNAILEEYTGKAGEQSFGTSVLIPNSISDFSVTEIGQSCFYDSSKKAIITAVTIPEGITKIDSWAFKECTALEGITVPSSVTDIGIWAFRNCAKFKYSNVTISNADTVINPYAFENCYGLELMGEMIPHPTDATMFTVLYNQPLYIEGVLVDDADHLVDVSSSYIASGVNIQSAIYNAGTHAVDFVLDQAPGNFNVNYATDSSIELRNFLEMKCPNHGFILTSDYKKIYGPKYHIESNDVSTLVLSFDLPLYDHDGALGTGANLSTMFSASNINILSATYCAEFNTVTLTFDSPGSFPSLTYTGDYAVFDEDGNESVFPNAFNYSTITGLWSDLP